MTEKDFWAMPGTADIAEQWLNRMDGERWFRDPDYNGPCEAVDPGRVDDLAQALLAFVADVVASILDAGSERDAVNENEELLAALTEEIAGWTARGGAKG